MNNYLQVESLQKSCQFSQEWVFPTSQGYVLQSLVSILNIRVHILLSIQLRNYWTSISGLNKPQDFWNDVFWTDKTKGWWFG